MSPADFHAFKGRFLSDMEDLLTLKGEDYTPDKIDRLSNFKQGSPAGLGPMKMWWVLATKHYNAITSYVNSGRVASEAIRGRFLDLANYCLLGAAIVDESNPPA